MWAERRRPPGWGWAGGADGAQKLLSAISFSVLKLCSSVWDLTPCL